MATGADEWVRLGAVRRAWGRRGGLKIRVDTDWPEQRFAPGARLWLAVSDEEPRPVRVRAFAGGDRLELEGVDSIDDAESLAGAVLCARLAELAPPEGELWRPDLEGLEVLDTGGRRIGRVEEVESGVACDLLRVRLADGGEALVPLAPAICREIDQQRGRVVIDPPAGLLDPRQAETASPEEGR
jgi:16S rRNA processing protein RimM